MTRLRALKLAAIAFCFYAAVLVESPAQTVTTLVNFEQTNGANPEYMSLTQGLDGDFYGTTAFGGNANCSIGVLVGCGTVFKLVPSGALATLYTFCAIPDCNDGANPLAGLVQATDGNLYGTTSQGGDPACNYGSGCGTVFKITPEGKIKTLHVFEGSDGNSPSGSLIQATDGNFYGTTQGGLQTEGTIFKITPAGVLTNLYFFGGTDGASPSSGVIQATNGKLYGTTRAGGDGFFCSDGCGTVFKISLAGRLTTLHIFEYSDGEAPNGLIQALDGNFYGTTYFSSDNDGTIFKIAPDGALTTLHSFCSQNNCSDGFQPYAGLVQGTDGNLYGTTSRGGLGNFDGTIFQTTATGQFTTVHSFSFVFGGIDPLAGLIQATNGKFYGTTNLGGDFACNSHDGCGTAFSLDVDLGPFVTFVRAAGKVGQTGDILGQGLTGTTSVSLNGIQADFTVVSDTYIKATVPAGATTGYVTVTTPSGTLTSNVPFHVIK